MEGSSWEARLERLPDLCKVPPALQDSALLDALSGRTLWIHLLDGTPLDTRCPEASVWRTSQNLSNQSQSRADSHRQPREWSTVKQTDDYQISRVRSAHGVRSLHEEDESGHRERRTVKRISWRMDSGTISTRPYVFQLQRLTWYGRYCQRRWRWDVLRRKSTRERRVDLGFLIVAGSRRDVSRRIVYVLLTRGEMRKIVISLLSGHRIHLLPSLSFPLASSLYSALPFLRFSSFFVPV